MNILRAVVLVLIVLCLSGCIRDLHGASPGHAPAVVKRINAGRIVVFGARQQVQWAAPMLKKLNRRNLPFVLHVYCRAGDKGGCFEHGSGAESRRMVVSGATKREVERVCVHEYQHAVDHASGLSYTPQWREYRAKQAEIIAGYGDAK